MTLVVDRNPIQSHYVNGVRRACHGCHRHKHLSAQRLRQASSVVSQTCLPSPSSHTSAWTPASSFTVIIRLRVDASVFLHRHHTPPRGRCVFLHRHHTPPRGRQRLPSPSSHTSSWTPVSSFTVIIHLRVARQRLPSPSSHTSSWTPASSFTVITHLLVDFRRSASL